MTLRPILLLALLIVAVPQIAAAQDAACLSLFAGGQTPVLLDARLATRTTVLCNTAYAALASGVTHGTVWSAEHPTRASLAAARQISREGEFHSEDRLPAADQAQLGDYRRSGYDRGHMTPSGDMPDQAAQEQSFSLANIVPQTPELNRGIWEGIESAVRRLVRRDGELYLVTGPAFHGERISAIGPDGVLVPTSTWKAVDDPARNEAGVYVCKNIEAPTCDVVSVATLIRVVGIDPFPALPDAVKQVAMALPQPEQSPYARASRARQTPDPPASTSLIGFLMDLLLGSHPS